MRASFFALIPLMGAWACTVTVQSNPPPPPADGGGVDSATPDDAGGDSAAPGYPAFLPEFPQIRNQKGGVLSAPKIVTVTWTSDPNAATFDTFGDVIGASSYWNATTSEYGVSAATGGQHVHITDAPPTSMSDTDLDNFVNTQVSSAPGSGWPMVDAQTLYLVYLPSTLSLTTGGQDACPTEAGYHDETSGSGFVYGVVIEACHSSQPVIEFSTETASHELVEIVTDPHVQSTPAWIGFDKDHVAWDLWLQRADEVGDACESFDDSYYVEQSPLAYRVQRTWSNAAAKGGHNPCVPKPVDPYFTTTPLGLDPAVTFTPSGSQQVTTKGYIIPVGTTRTIQLGFTSDAPVGPWTIDVVEGDGVTPVTTSQLTIVTKKLSGQNGDTADVDVTVNSLGTSPGNLVTVLSTLNGLTRYMPFIVLGK